MEKEYSEAKGKGYDNLFEEFAHWRKNNGVKIQRSFLRGKNK